MNIYVKRNKTKKVYTYIHVYTYKFIEGAPELISFFSFNCEFFDQFRFDKLKFLIRKKSFANC